MPRAPDAAASPPPRGRLAAVLGEPLLHFLVIGGLLFAALTALEARREEVRLSDQEVAQLDAYWRAQSDRAPTAAELRSMVDDRIDEEIMAREARRLGLDEDDVIIRRRLAQKYQFVREDLAAPPEPDAAQLRAFYDAHQALFTAPGTIAFRQLYFSRERGPEAAQAAAAAALARLKADPDAAVDGDPFIMPLAQAAATAADLRRDYGDAFAAALAAAPAGAWSGPLPSAYGWHLVYVAARSPDRVLPFAEAEPQVAQRWREAALAERRTAARAELRRRYTIVLPDGVPGA